MVEDYFQLILEGVGIAALVVAMIGLVLAE